jgi:chromatin modification-related protein EAF6
VRKMWAANLNATYLLFAQLRLEDEILKAETTYLEETSTGNIIKGFDNYIKGTTTTAAAGGAGTATRRKAPISDVDRIFSRSSTSFLRESSTPGSAQTPSSHAPTPTSSFPTRESSQPKNGMKGGGGSKKKNTGDDDDEDGKSSKRQKISYGREWRTHRTYPIIKWTYSANHYVQW